MDDFGQSHNYGQRKCMSCGKIFTAEKPSQITCGPECQTSRARLLGRLRQRARTAKISDLAHDIAVLDTALKESCPDFEKAEAAMKKAGGLRRHVWKRPDSAPDGNPAEKTEAAEAAPIPAAGDAFPPKAEEPARKAFPSSGAPEPENIPEKSETAKSGKPAAYEPKGERMYCERMKVWAESMPCGEREECFLSPRCEKVPAGIARLAHRCEICGKELENTKGGRRYCSASCRMKASRRKQTARTDDRLWNSSMVEESL